MGEGMGQAHRHQAGDSHLRTRYVGRLENNWDRPLTRRSMPGGFVDQDPSDEFFTDMLAEVYFSRNDALQEEDLELVKVQSQVVSGINYKFIFKVAGSGV